MHFRDVVLAQQVRAHAVEDGDVDLSLQLVVFGGVSEEQMRQRPQPTANSLAYVLWHMTRTKEYTLSWSVLAHTFLHFGEAYGIGHQLGMPTL